MTIYEEREYAEAIEEALEDLWNGRDESFRDKLIYGLLGKLREKSKALDQTNKYVEKFTHRDLVDIGCKGYKESNDLSRLFEGENI